MVQVLKKSVDLVSLHKSIIMILGLFLLTFVVVPQVVEAQSALKISSLSDVESKAQEGSNTILNIAKYVLAAVLGISARLDHCGCGYYGSFPYYLINEDYKKDK